MNDETEKPETDEAIVDEEAQEPRKQSRVGLWVVALIALLSFGMSGHLFHRLNTAGEEEDKLEVRMAGAESSLAQSHSPLSQLNAQDLDLQRKLKSLEQEQVVLRNKFSEVLRKQSMGNNDWALAEVEHLLVIASHRLKLEKNVAMALAALQAADDRLKNINDPGLLGVRQQLASDMNTLKEISPVDISGLALFLSDVVSRAPQLPLKPVVINDDQPSEDEAVAPLSQSSWDRLMNSIWKDLRSLVQVSKTGEDTPATLAPNERYFLYQNLRLQLESARYAVLRRDTENLHVSSDIIVDWLNRYFDISDSGVANILESVSKMSQLELNPELPEVSSSIETLRAYQHLEDAMPGGEQDQAR